MARGMHCSENDGFLAAWVQVSFESVVVYVGAGQLVVLVHSSKLRVRNMKPCEFERCSNGGPTTG